MESYFSVFCFCLLQAFSLNIDVVFINLWIYEMWICTLSFWYLCEMAETLPISRQGFGLWDFDISMGILAIFHDLCSKKLTKSASFITSSRDSQFSFWPLRSLDNTVISPAKNSMKKKKKHLEIHNFSIIGMVTKNICHTMYMYILLSLKGKL